MEVWARWGCMWRGAQTFYRSIKKASVWFARLNQSFSSCMRFLLCHLNFAQIFWSVRIQNGCITQGWPVAKNVLFLYLEAAVINESPQNILRPIRLRIKFFHCSFIKLNILNFGRLTLCAVIHLSNPRCISWNQVADSATYDNVFQ